VGGCRASSWAGDDSSGEQKSGPWLRRRVVFEPETCSPSCSTIWGASPRPVDVRALLERMLARPSVATIRTVFDVYGQAAGGLLANGLAFTALFAAIPSTLLVLGVAGWVAAGDPEIQQQLTGALVAALPPLSDLIRSAVDAVTDRAGFTSLVGLVGLVWTVSQFFGAVDVAFARIFASERERGALWRTVRGVLVVGVLVAIVVGMIVTLGLVAVVDAAGGRPGALVDAVSGVLGSPFVRVLGAAAAVVIAYRFLPPAPPAWRSLLLPAVVVAALLLLFSQVFGFLAPRLVGVSELAGPLASGFVALAWLSFSFQALLLGATWVRVRDERRSAGLERAAAPAEPGVGGQ
jgi:membrane protein